MKPRSSPDEAQTKHRGARPAPAVRPRGGRQGGRGRAQPKKQDGARVDKQPARARRRMKRRAAGVMRNGLKTDRRRWKNSHRGTPANHPRARGGRRPPALVLILLAAVITLTFASLKETSHETPNTAETGAASAGETSPGPGRTGPAGADAGADLLRQDSPPTGDGVPRRTNRAGQRGAHQGRGAGPEVIVGHRLRNGPTGGS